MNNGQSEKLDIATVVANIWNVSKRKCDGNHPKNGCDWEKCLATADLLTQLKHQICAEIEGLKDVLPKKTRDDFDHIYGYNNGLDDALSVKSLNVEEE